MKPTPRKAYAVASASSTQQINALDKATVSTHSGAVHMDEEQQAG